MAPITKDVCDGVDTHGRRMSQWDARKSGSIIPTVPPGVRGKYNIYTGTRCSDNSTQAACNTGKHSKIPGNPGFPDGGGFSKEGDQFILAPMIDTHICLSSKSKQSVDADGDAAIERIAKRIADIISEETGVEPNYLLNRSGIPDPTGEVENDFTRITRRGAGTNLADNITLQESIASEYDIKFGEEDEEVDSRSGITIEADDMPTLYGEEEDLRSVVSLYQVDKAGGRTIRALARAIAQVKGFLGADYAMQCMMAGGRIEMELPPPPPDGPIGGIFRGPIYPWEFFQSGTDEHEAALLAYRNALRDCDPDTIKLSRRGLRNDGHYSFDSIMYRCEIAKEEREAAAAERAAAAAEQLRIWNLGVERGETLKWMFTRDKHGTIPIMGGGMCEEARLYSEKYGGMRFFPADWTENEKEVARKFPAVECNVFEFTHPYTEGQDPLGYPGFLRKCLTWCAGNEYNDCQGVLFSNDGKTCKGKMGPITNYHDDVNNPFTHKFYERSQSLGIDPKPWEYDHYNMSKPLALKAAAAKADDVTRKEQMSHVFSLSETDRCGGRLMKSGLSTAWDGRPGTGTHEGTRCPGTECCSNSGYCGGKQGESSTYCDGTATDRERYGNPTEPNASKYSHGDKRINLETLEIEPASHIGSNFGNYDGLGSVIDDAEKLRKKEELEANIEFCLDERADHCRTEELCTDLKDGDNEFVCPQKPKISDRSLLLSENKHVVKGYPMIVDEELSGWVSTDYNVPAGRNNTQAIDYCKGKQGGWPSSPGFSVWRESSTTSNFETDHDYKCRVYTDNNEELDFLDECANQPWGNNTKCMKKPGDVSAYDVDGQNNAWASGGLFWRRKTVADMQEANVIGLSQPQVSDVPEPGNLISNDNKECPRQFKAERVDGGDHCISEATLKRNWRGDILYRNGMPRITPADCRKNGGWDTALKIRCDDGTILDFGTAGQNGAFQASKKTNKTIEGGICPNQNIGNDKFVITMSECGTPSYGPYGYDYKDKDGRTF